MVRAEKKLIEEWLPLRELSDDAGTEQTFGKMGVKYYKEACLRFGIKKEKWIFYDPKLRALHLWLARRPCGLARALTLASLLPASSKGDFNEIIGYDALSSVKNYPPLLLYVNPNRELLKKALGKDPKEIVVVDPMSGGGGIPFESLRLGFKTVACDYNPVAYLVLKATLEYPAKYGDKLYDDVKSEAKKLIEHAELELSKFYPGDVQNYIIARGFECPECKTIVPVFHGTQLRAKGPFISFQFDKESKECKIDVTKEKTEFERLKCPNCGRPFTKEELFAQWIPRHKELLKIALSGDVEKALTMRAELLKVNFLLLKKISRGFVPCGFEDQDSFYESYLELTKRSNDLKEYIPATMIPKENRVFNPVNKLGIQYWYELFNPRQLLVFAVLTKYLNDLTKSYLLEKGEYAAALAIYLAFGLDKLRDYNNIATMWDIHAGNISRLGDQYAAKKSVSLGLEYCEAKRIDLALDWVFEPNVDRSVQTRGGILPVLNYLCGAINGMGDRIEVLMSDARELSKIIEKDSVNLINVDPPYFGQHFYSDLSEFFWQSLLSSLKPIIDAGFLFNRNKHQGKIECLVSGWGPSLPMVPRSGEIIVRPGTGKPNNIEIEFTKEWWRKQMWWFFTEAHRVLKEDSHLVIWYTHSDPEAWEAILSGLYAGDFDVDIVWTIRTEAGRFIARLGGSAFFTSLALIASKSFESVIVGHRDPKELILDEQVKNAILNSVKQALQSAKVSGASNWEAYTMALAGAIAGATHIRNPALEALESSDETLNSFLEQQDERKLAEKRFKRLSHFFRDSLYPIALYLGALTVLQEEIQRSGLSSSQVNLVIDVDNSTKAYLLFWLSTRYIAENSLPSIDYDFIEKICKVLDTRIDSMESSGLIERSKGNLYQLLFGVDTLEKLKGKTETIDRTAAASAIFLLKLIADAPIRDKEEKSAKHVLSIKVFNKQVISVALFLLRTAREEELRKASISPLIKPFVEKVLIILYEGR